MSDNKIVDDYLESDEEDSEYAEIKLEDNGDLISREKCEYYSDEDDSDDEWCKI